MLLVKMIDQLEKNIDVNQYIQDALTCGVKINNHGDCSYFRKRVDRFKEIF